MNQRAVPILVLLLGAVGCAKMSPGDASYGYDQAEMYAMEGEAERIEADRSFGRRSKRAEMSAAPSAPSSVMDEDAGGAPPAVNGGEPAAEPEPAIADDTDQDVGRYIVYTATMQVSVFNLEDAMIRAESLPDKYGGYVQNMANNYFVMRIPSAKLRPAMDELATMGVVDSRTLDAMDVTEEFLDIQTRIEVLQNTQKQMMELLTKARTVQEALEVRKALDQITMELEVLKGRLRRLSSLVSFSTLTLSLVERGPHTNTPSSNDPFPWVDSLGVEATEWK